MTRAQARRYSRWSPRTATSRRYARGRTLAPTLARALPDARRPSPKQTLRQLPLSTTPGARASHASGLPRRAAAELRWHECDARRALPLQVERAKAALPGAASYEPTH